MGNTNSAIVARVQDEFVDAFSEDDRIDEIQIESSHEQYVYLTMTVSGDEQDSVARTAHSELMPIVRDRLDDSELEGQETSVLVTDEPDYYEYELSVRFKRDSSQ